MLKIEKGYDTVSKTFRIPTEQASILEKLAEENKISLNRLVVQCLQYAIENIGEDGDSASKNDVRPNGRRRDDFLNLDD